MPIGASKVGALGGLVPGGSVTFNASGTWDVPPGVKIVSITGKGGTGNPGNAGNQGNPGNPGTGAGGGAAGTAISGLPPCQGIGNRGGDGGNAFKRAAFPPCVPESNNMWVCNTPFNTVNTNCVPKYTLGGKGAPAVLQPGQLGSNAGNPGQGGQSGNAGTAGNPGNPGNPGCSSSALGNTFPGGAGGNAGAGGAAGNGGQGGTGGGGGKGAPQNYAAGVGGTGGGIGSNGAAIPKLSFLPQGCTGQWYIRNYGGGGAGVTNSGANAIQNAVALQGPPSQENPQVSRRSAGGTGQLVRNAANPQYPNVNWPGLINQQGGMGGFPVSPQAFGAGTLVTISDISNPIITPNNIYTLQQYNPAPLRPELIRAGGGGGANSLAGNGPQLPNPLVLQVGGGGGGGGRGIAGNAGGPTPTPTGATATPVTFNCVPVTPGTPTPITVASPGGQVVISWNPQ